MIASTLPRARFLVDSLTTAGVRATADPRNVNPPCVLLDRPAVEPINAGCTSWQLSWVLHVIVPGGGDNTLQWEKLDALTSSVLAVIGPQGVTVTPDTYPLNDTTDLPSNRVEFPDVI